MSVEPNTQSDFIQKAKKIHSDTYDYNKTVFINNRTRIIITCKYHGDFLQFPKNHLNGSGCKKCASDKRKIPKTKILFNDSSGKKLNNEEVIERFRKVHSDKYDYSKVNYIKYNSLIEIICPEHGKFKMLPCSHWNGSGCPKCNKTSSGKKLNNEEVIERFRKVHLDKYDYSKVNYIKNSEKIIILCKEHGEFKMLPYLHWSGSGCPKCRNYFTFSQETILEKLKTVGNINDTFEKVEYKNMHSPVIITCKIHGDYEKSLANYFSGFRCIKCSPKSKLEIELLNIFPDFLRNSRKIIKPLEIDLFSEEHKFGIEINGVMFHSYGFHKSSIFNNFDLLNKNKHLNKTLKMEEKGYQLFHIKDIDWNNSIKKEIWKSVLLNKCGISHKIHARKLDVVNLNPYQDFVKQFLEENHLQGNCPSSIKLGLQDPKTGIVYSIMTFGKSRFDKNMEFELLRFCNLRYHNVRGAASKLMSAFEKYYNPDSIVSYANRDWSMGNLYKVIGFAYSHTSEPNYIYIDSKLEIIKRQQVQKHKLKNFLESRNQVFNENLSERDNMIDNGYRIYYDTGNLVYHKFYKEENNVDTIAYLK